MQTNRVLSLIKRFMKYVIRNDNLSEVYASPASEVVFVNTQGVICTSETEKVTETEGEW